MPGKKTLNILPYWCKFLGGALIMLGLISSFYFIYLSIKPDCLQFRVFTIYSKYLETNTLTFIKNNQGDELAISCYLVGFIIFILAGDPKHPDLDFLYKSRAAVYTLILTVFVLSICYLLVHGIAVIYTVALIVYLIPVVFFIIYLILRTRRIH